MKREERYIQEYKPEYSLEELSGLAQALDAKLRDLVAERGQTSDLRIIEVDVEEVIPGTCASALLEYQSVDVAVTVHAHYGEKACAHLLRFITSMLKETGG